MKDELGKRDSRSTSVDVEISWISRNVKKKKLIKLSPNNNECRLRKRDASYPTITRRRLARHRGEEVNHKRRLFKGKELDPNTYITLHKIITVGKFAVYYIGTDQHTGKPKTVKIYRPTFKLFEGRRAGLEKQILSLPDKPECLPTLEFAYRYEFYKCLVLEPLFNESLEEKLLYARRLLPEVVKSFMLDMVCALAFLHTKKIIHRNLTLNSFWIQSNRRLKLTDYNHCTHKRGLQRWSNFFRIKPTSFTAPELFKSSPYSRQTDIWALGVIFYRMTSGRFPFYGEDPRDLKQKIQNTDEEYNEFFTSDSAYFCTEMLNKDPMQRLGYRTKTEWAFRDNPYFADCNWTSAYSQTINGPQIIWKFPVAHTVEEKRRGVSGDLTLDDIDNFDASKLRKKPLRMDAIKDGSHMFSPEYLEQLYPRKVTSQGVIIPTDGQGENSLEAHLSRFNPSDVSLKSRIKKWLPITSLSRRHSPKSPEKVVKTTKPKRDSTARKVSLKANLMQAFNKLEERMDSNEDVVGALDAYYKAISKDIDRFANGKKLKLPEKTTSKTSMTITSTTTMTTSAESTV